VAKSIKRKAGSRKAERVLLRHVSGLDLDQVNQGRKTLRVGGARKPFNPRQVSNARDKFAKRPGIRRECVGAGRADGLFSAEGRVRSIEARGKRSRK